MTKHAFLTLVLGLAISSSLGVQAAHSSEAADLEATQTVSAAENIIARTFVVVRPGFVKTTVTNPYRFAIRCQITAQGQTPDGAVWPRYEDLVLYPFQTGLSMVVPPYAYFLPLGPYSASGGFSDCWAY